MIAARDVFAEVLRAVLSDQVMPDGTPITASTVGGLMKSHLDALKAMIAEDGGGAE